MVRPNISFQSYIDVQPLVREVNKARKNANREMAKAVQKEAKQLTKTRATRGRNRQGRFTKGGTGSKPGQPPKRRTGNLNRSIRYKIGKTVAWVGTVKPKGAHGQLMKWGRRASAKTGRLEPRPFMQPALDRVRSTLPLKWQNKL